MPYINIELINNHPRNKEFFDDIEGSQWEEFKQSIATSGIICPIIITQDNLLVSGSQRIKAAKQLGIKQVLYEKREYKDKDGILKEDWILKDLIETNLSQRGKGNLNYIKLSNCICELKRIYNIKKGNNQVTRFYDSKNITQMTSKKLAKMLGLTERRVQQIAKLYDLIPEFKQLIGCGKMTTSLGIRLSSLSQDNQELLYQVQGNLHEYKLKENLSISEFEQGKNDLYEIIEAIKQFIKVPKELELNANETNYDKVSAHETMHTEIQWLLLNVGSEMGLNVWVGKDNVNKEFKGIKFQNIKNTINDLPTQFSKETRDIIEMIDVLWLQGDAIIAAFEIEHTTPVYSGLLRLSDLVTTQPNIKINLYIVAPDERKAKVIKELNRPTFAKLKLPLPQICKLIQYSRLKDKIQRSKGMLQYLNPEFIEEIAECCELHIK